jgi:hypothetical protein
MVDHPNSLIQIVPSLWPAVDGIGDYALQLARQLRAQAGVETTFIVCDPAWSEHLWTGEFKVVRLKERTEKRMLEEVLWLLTGDWVINSRLLLHFSPYGYQKRGCPIWLVAALEAVNQKLAGRVNVAFHELDVDSSRILSSAYWVPGLQRFLIRRLLRISAFAYTNTDTHRLKLQAWIERDVSLIPNFANIGESDEPLPTAIRERSVVVFGRADQRRWTYAKGARALSRVCACINATRIVDIGAPIPEHTCTHIDGVPVDRRGLLPANEIATTMRSSLASFMYYPVPLLTKSGVHAVACATGNIPFICSDTATRTTCPGLTEGVDYIVVNDAQPLPSLITLERLAPAIHTNYGKRTSKVAAMTIASELFGPNTTARDMPAFAGSFRTGSSTLNSIRISESSSPTQNREVVR